MPFVPFANTAECEVRYELDGQKVENTLYFTQADAYTSGSLGNLATIVLDWAVASLLPLQNNVCLLREVFARDLSTEDGLAAVAAADSGALGAAGPGAPNNSTICVSFRSGVTGRSQRGRNYLIGLPVSAMANTNHVSNAYQGEIIVAYNTLKGDAQDEGFTHVIASRRHNKDWRAVGQTTQVVSYTFVDATVDSQRRRLPGRGQ